MVFLFLFIVLMSETLASHDEQKHFQSDTMIDLIEAGRKENGEIMLKLRTVDSNETLVMFTNDVGTICIEPWSSKYQNVGWSFNGTLAQRSLLHVRCWFERQLLRHQSRPLRSRFKLPESRAMQHSRHLQPNVHVYGGAYASPCHYEPQTQTHPVDFLDLHLGAGLKPGQCPKCSIL